MSPPPSSQCPPVSGAMSPEAMVTFTTPVNVTDLLPNAPASYFDGDIEISPLPVITGISTTMTVKLTNPLTQSITVDVSFGFAQSGIGLVFGPIKDIVGQVIPGNSSVSLVGGVLAGGVGTLLRPGDVRDYRDWVGAPTPIAKLTPRQAGIGIST